MYWTDSREQHGSGRRVIRQSDQLRSGLGGGYGGNQPGGLTSSSYGSGLGQAPAAGRRAPPPSEPFDVASVEEFSGCPAGEPLPGPPPPDGADDGASYLNDPQEYVREGANSQDLGGETGLSEFPAPDRRNVGGEAHMTNAGTSAPVPERHGRGRRYIEAEDHQVTRAFFDGDDGSVPEQFAPVMPAQGRRAIQPADHVKQHVLKPVEEIQCAKPPTNAEMKEAVKEWIIAVHNMIISDERRWDEAEVRPRGNHWVIEAFTETRKTLSREGPTARAIAEKLSMMPIAELRHYGVRFAGNGDVQVGPARREKRSGWIEDNPTLVSPGVHNAFGRDDRAPAGGHISVRKVPDAVHRRYIASGKDNFAAQGQPISHGQGHVPKDTDFSDGMERAIGRGRRYIGTKDSVHDVLYGGSGGR